MPDKAIDLINKGASRLKLINRKPPNNLIALEEKLANKEAEKNQVVAEEKFEEAAKLRDKAGVIKKKIEKARNSWQKENSADAKELKGEDIAKIVTEWTGIPVGNISMEDSKKLINLEKTLHERVIGQYEALSALAKAVRRARAGLKTLKTCRKLIVFRTYRSRKN